MLNPIKPKTGRLLISEPFMIDPNFKRSVVLITEHGEEGTVGYILNQVGNLILGDVIQDLGDFDSHIYFGGPVAADTLHFIHRCYNKLQSGEPIGNGLYWGGDFETLKILISTGSIDQSEVKFFLGYSGWDESQLDREIEGNAWMVSDILDIDSIFTNDDEQLWRDVIVNLGPKYAHVSNFPVDPSLN
ncbi:YqgE/AlgH family protein [Pedobacter mucosus]|uniref:YqgE/AlgH family protein n=1 Tax=Pedobacter mucosus TaxID=2895286 RepID=UPI001EE3A33C|nr:YqgE/AlgH family protein [Pedobacter mucosus]UKT65354.1 YqgE/AlgH family protein [Pedobacter mucosus]